MLNKRGILLCSLLALAFSGKDAFASRYANGIEGIKAASVPGPGLYFKMYNYAYNANTLTDDNGDELDIGFEVDTYAISNRLIWVSDKKILGGNYFADFVIPIVSVDIEIDASQVSDNESGIGDIYLEPLGIAWHGKQHDTAVALGVFLDNADFDADEAASIGAGYVTYMITGGGTYYFDEEKKWSGSLLARYEIHTEQDETDITRGDEFHFEFGVGYNVGSNTDVGVSGYFNTQVESDSGPGADSNKDRVFAIGPEVSKFFASHNWLVSFRTLKEFKAENAPEGVTSTLTLTKIF